MRLPSIASWFVAGMAALTFIGTHPYLLNGALSGMPNAIAFIVVMVASTVLALMSSALAMFPIVALVGLDGIGGLISAWNGQITFGRLAGILFRCAVLLGCAHQIRLAASEPRR